MKENLLLLVVGLLLFALCGCSTGDKPMTEKKRISNCLFRRSNLLFI